MKKIQEYVPCEQLVSATPTRDKKKTNCSQVKVYVEQFRSR